MANSIDGKILHYVQKICLCLFLMTQSAMHMGFVFTISSTQVAVRVNKIGLNRGIEDKVYTPGTYFYVPLFTEWYVFDTRVRNIDMSLTTDAHYQNQEALRFKTIDGNDISLDVTIHLSNFA